MCSTGPFQYRWLKGFILLMLLSSSSNRKYPPFPLLSYFSVVVCLRCLFHHIQLLVAYTFRENREFVFIIIVQFMMSANSRIRFWLEDRVRLFVHYTISLSSLCKFIWRHWTYKMLVRYILSSVLSILQYVGLCVFSLLISLVMIEIIYIRCLVIIIKSEMWTITYCLALGQETMVCGVCLSIFWYIIMWSTVDYISVFNYLCNGLLLISNVENDRSGRIIIVKRINISLLPAEYFLRYPHYSYMNIFIKLHNNSTILGHL